MRHSWVRLKTHTYICEKCGTGKRNAQHERGEWLATYHTAHGEAVVSATVPPCEIGQLTPERLAWLSSIIDSMPARAHDTHAGARVIRAGGHGTSSSKTPQSDATREYRVADSAGHVSGCAILPGRACCE